MNSNLNNEADNHATKARGKSGVTSAMELPPVFPTIGRTWYLYRGAATENSTSAKYAIAFGRQLKDRGFPGFPSQASVTVEIYKNKEVHRLTGKATSLKTASFAKTELGSIGINLHEAFYFSLLFINGSPADLAVFEGSLPSEPDLDPAGDPDLEYTVFEKGSAYISSEPSAYIALTFDEEAQAQGSSCPEEIAEFEKSFDSDVEP